jgi:spermidine synthase
MTRPAFPRALLAIVFFLSGVAGLGYEVVWGRWLHSVFGASAWALAAILSAFMAGLALGGFTAGRLAPRLRVDPLKAYGLIEILIGAWALLFPQLLDGVVAVQGRFFFQWVEHHTLYGLMRFGLSFLVLLVPTSLMGATFPLLSVYVARRSNAPTRWVGWLYGLNSAGAVFGTVLAGFVLIARFGLIGSNLLLAAVNFGVGVVAILRARADASHGSEEEPARVAAEASRGAATQASRGAPTEGSREADPEKEAPGAPSRGDLYRLILGIFLANGIFNLAHEVLWARALALIIGTTTYALSVMLGVFLAGIALGSLWMTRRLASVRDPLRLLLRIQAAMALWVLASPLLINALPYVFLRGLWALGIGWASSVAIKCLLTALLLLPLTVGMGAVFPLGIQLAFRRPEDLGREVGDLYSINTAGGILGAFIAGFLVIPVAGVERGLVVTALGHLAVVLALALASRQAREKLQRYRWRWAAVVAAALLLPLVTSWNPLILASGVYFQPRTFYDSDGRVLLAERMSQANLRYHAEGASATVDVLEAPGGFRALTINGKSVATSNYYDYRVQRLLGVLPLLLHPEPRRVLVIGLGTGMTSGTGSIDPATESLEIVEITGEVVGATEYFREWNLDVIDKPITSVVVEDATHYLRFVDRRYDVITSDPIHPFVSGAGDLYSVDNYEVARSKLESGGVFCQWVPLYQLDQPDIDSILRTFDQVWHNATVWVTGKDFILCAAGDGYRVSFESIATRARGDEYSEVLRLLGFWTPEELFSAYVGKLESLRQLFADAAVNTIERPFLEFSAPRSIFRPTDALNLARILEGTPVELPDFLDDSPPDLFRLLATRRPCTDLVWVGFVADRQGDLATATRLSRQAFDRCPQLGYVRHFAAHTIQAYAGSIRRTEPSRALDLLRRARELDPYTPEIAAAISEIEGVRD